MSPHRMCCRHRNLSTHVPVWHLMSHQGLSSRSCPATTDVRGDEPTRCFARSTSPEYQSRCDRRQSHSILREPPTTFVALVLAVSRPLLLCSDPMERNIVRLCSGEPRTVHFSRKKEGRKKTGRKAGRQEGWCFLPLIRIYTVIQQGHGHLAECLGLLGPQDFIHVSIQHHWQ